MSAPYRAPAPPEPPRKGGPGLTVLLGAAGTLVWLGALAVVFTVVGFMAMILAYAMMHSPPHSGPAAYGGDAGAASVDAASD